MIYVNDDQVEEKILSNPKTYINYLYQRMIEISGGMMVWSQPKIIYTDPINPNRGDIRPMTCFTDRVKIVKVISTNPIRKKNEYVSVGSLLSLDYEENYPHTIYDASKLSSIRTAALAHVVMRISECDYSDVLLIGKGEVGRYFLDLSPTIERINVYDIKYSEPIEKYEAKVIVSATTSTDPFLTTKNSLFKLLISLGADTKFNFEIGQSLLTTKEWIYVDTYDAFEVGDLSISKELKQNVKGTMLGLIKEKICEIFISVGNPLLDALTIEYLEGITESHEGYKNRK